MKANEPVACSGGEVGAAWTSSLESSGLGWAVGLAAKKDAGDLAAAVQGVLDPLVGGRRHQQIFEKGRVARRPV